MKNKNEISEWLAEKKVLFITTKGPDYIRNCQEMELCRNYADKVSCISSSHKRYIWRILEVFYKIACTSIKNFDILFIGFAPQLILPWWHFKFRKKVIIIDFFISVYDTLAADRKIVKADSVCGKLCKWIDMKTLKLADRVIVDTNAHRLYFEQELCLDSSKARVLYLEADRNLYFPRTAVRPEEWEDKFLVLYFGSILPLQGIDIVLKAMELVQEYKSVHFIIIGPIGSKYEKFISETVTYINWIPQEKLAEMISYADLCLAGHFSDQIQKANRTIPGKAFIYHAMKKPMILGESDANSEVFSETENDVYYVKRGNSDALANKILELYHCIKQRRVV